MQTIYKYPLPLASENPFSIKMPEGAKILSLQPQGNSPVIWALVDTDRPLVDRYFNVYLTGREIKGESPIPHFYVGTVQLDHQTYVIHLFEALVPIGKQGELNSGN